MLVSHGRAVKCSAPICLCPMTERWARCGFACSRVGVCAHAQIAHCPNFSRRSAGSVLSRQSCAASRRCYRSRCWRAYTWASRGWYGRERLWSARASRPPLRPIRHATSCEALSTLGANSGARGRPVICGWCNRAWWWLGRSPSLLAPCITLATTPSADPCHMEPNRDLSTRLGPLASCISWLVSQSAPSTHHRLTGVAADCQSTVRT